MDFKGTIGPGYGEGEVDVIDKDMTEVVHMSPDKVHFNLYRGRGPEEYSLIRTGDKRWLMLNRTISRQKVPGLPEDKPSYRELKPEQIDFNNPDEILQAKIDGAHNLIVIPKSGMYPKFISHRPGKRVETGVIEHTHKVPGAMQTPIPRGLRDTIVRGEIYAMGPNKKAIMAKDLGGLLNASVWKSRIQQEAKKTPLKAVVFDVVRFRGKDVELKPYAEKLKMLKEVIDSIDILDLPPMAQTPEEKRRLFERIKSGKLPETKEGVVVWNLKDSKAPIKYKLKDEYDVHVRGFFDAKPGSKYDDVGVGGFTYSHLPDGPIVGRVGTGLNDRLRKEMYENPKKYLGAVAKVNALDIYPLADKADRKGTQKGALRAPSFSQWHLDKNDVEFLKSASMLFFDNVIDMIIKDFNK
jgi:bifunctional non-homologous end joining protein LigD